MPYPPFRGSFEVKDIYFKFLPMWLVLCFIFIVPANIRNVISEKESGIKVRLFFSQKY
jgi:hypothetical protein